MEVITDFGGGLVTNFVYNNKRKATAQYVRDCRVNDFGWLVPRKGRIATDQAPVSPLLEVLTLPKMDAGQVLYNEVGGAAVAPHLKSVQWVFQAVKIDAEQEDLPARQGTVDADFPVLAPRVVIGEKSEPKSVETLFVPEVTDDLGEFDPETRADVHTLRIYHKEGAIAIQFRITGSNDYPADHRLNTTTLTIQVVDFESRRVIKTLRENRVYHFHGERDREPDQEEGPFRKEVTWDGTDDFGEFIARPDKYWIAFTERIPIVERDDAGNELPITEYSYHQSFIAFDIISHSVEVAVGTPADTNYVDIFSTGYTGGEHNFYWIARVAAGGTFTYQFPVIDNLKEVIDFETPMPAYITENEFRRYAAEVRSNKLYLSHYDTENSERLLHNFTDTIDLDLGDNGFITGLRFLRDNVLVVYCSNQIQLVSTAAEGELHAVIDHIRPRDRVGEHIGCVTPASIVDMGGYHLFFATNRHIYMFDGQVLREISDSIRGVFETVAEPTLHADGGLNLQTAVGFAKDRHYCLSVGQNSETPNTTIVYDTDHGIYWQDSFGVTAASRDATGRVYATIGDAHFILYEGDDDAGEPIRRVWRGNPFFQHSQERWKSTHVWVQDPATVDVRVSTELDEHTGQLIIANVRNPYENRLGSHLVGRVQTVEIATESAAAIDRISINERIRH